ncbi:MAG: hypothetical protein LUD72_01455 [Bacteroidales bacterium]|nr:hypothetical protein [Bacteroidales bacterium]
MRTDKEIQRLVAERVRGGQVLPTPNASDWKGGTPHREGDSYLKHWLSKLKGGTAYPSPAFLEEMMGFPIGYTLEPFLEKKK